MAEVVKPHVVDKSSFMLSIIEQPGAYVVEAQVFSGPNTELALDAEAWTPGVDGACTLAESMLLSWRVAGLIGCHAEIEASGGIWEYLG
jgi:hypothetical protein